MTTATIKQAKLRLGELVTRVRRGESVVIELDGKPVVRLVPADEPDLELSAGENRNLNDWADKERTAVHTKVFESPAAYAAKVRATRGGKDKVR